MEDLIIQNEMQAEEIYGSAFYYGNIDREAWLKMMTNFLNSATLRGIQYASNNQRTLR